jgi:cleavage and polyadenylation specificity factor subunit 3
MTRFKSKLLSLNANKPKPIKVFSPANCEELRIPFRTDKIAKVVGKLAQIHPPLPLHLKESSEAQGDEESKKFKEAAESTGITGVLVQNEFKLSLMAPEDLKEYAGLTTTTIICREHLTLRAAGVELIRWALQAAFGEVTELSSPKNHAVNGSTNRANGYAKIEDADEEIDRATRHFLVMGTVNVIVHPRTDVEVEWEGNMLNDGVADAVLGVLLSVERSPAAVRQSSSSHSHSHSHSKSNGRSESVLDKRMQARRKADTDPKERLSRLFLLLESQFGTAITPISTPRGGPPAGSGAQLTPPPDAELSDAEVKAALERLHRLGIPVPGVEITVGNQTAKVWLEDLSVESKSVVLRGRVEAVIAEAVEGVAPLWGGVEVE